MRFLIVFFLLIISLSSFATGYNVYGIGIYDIKFDGKDTNEVIDLRYERRFDKSLINIGPEEDNFFYLKPFIGFEYTGDNASYFITGVYIEEDFDEIIGRNENLINFTPSFGFGYYDDGNGKKLGNNLEFRTSLEFSYNLKNNNRIGLSLSHISNANIGDKNPGVEIVSISYQVPY